MGGLGTVKSDPRAQQSEPGCRSGNKAMIELLRTNDPVLLSFAASVLRAENVACLVMDGHASVLDGSLGMLPRRLMVVSPFARRARQLLIDAGLGPNLSVTDDALGEVPEDEGPQS